MNYVPNSTIALAIELHDAKLREAEIQAVTLGMEGIMSSAFGAAIKDIARSVVKTIGTNIRYWNDAFKRSEFVYFYDSNKNKLERYLSDTSVPLLDIPVPTPEGMDVPYLQAIQALISCKNEIQMVPYLKAVSSVVQILQDGVEDGVIGQANAIISEFHPTETSKNVAAQLKAILSGRRMAAKSSREVFSSKEDISECIQQVLTFNETYHEMVDFKVTIDGVNEQFNALISMLERREKEFSRSTLQAVYTLVSGMAVYVDHFGVVAHEMQRVEHNFTTAVGILLRHSR